MPLGRRTIHHFTQRRRSSYAPATLSDMQMHSITPKHWDLGLGNDHTG